MRWPKRQREQQFDTEMKFHLDELIDNNIAAGMSPEEARRQALIEFGGTEQLKEDLRDVQRWSALESAVRNSKSALRFLRKSPSFSLAVILTLALGIGANSAVFSAIYAVLLRPLPFPQADRLVTLHQHKLESKSPEERVAPVRVEDWARLNSTFRAMTGYYTDDMSETSGPLPEKLTIAWVSPRFLETWGIAPLVGRPFRPEEHRVGGAHGYLISERLWRRKFNADPNLSGKRLRSAGSSTPIVGVLPASFRFPIADVDVWAPSPLDSPYTQPRDNTWYDVVGRLKDGVTLQQAEANLTTVQAQLARQYPKTDAHLQVRMQPLKEATVGGVRASLLLLFGSVTLLLLIACTNIAALLLARTKEREREISIRFSLGASRRSVMGQLLSEAFALALAGSLLGLLIAAGAARFFQATAKTLPRVEEIYLNWHVLLYSLICAVMVTVLAGTIPAFRSTRQTLNGSLAGTSRTQVSTSNRLQWGLVATQVALAVTLLVGAGLLLRSFAALSRTPLGFDPEHVLTFHVSGDYAETVDWQKLRARIDHSLQELATVPGITAAATTSALPGLAGAFDGQIKIVEKANNEQDVVAVDFRVISPGYVEALRMPLVAGEGCRRSFTGSNALVNQSFVNEYLKSDQPLGYHLAFSPNPYKEPPMNIKGVLADARENGPTRAPVPTVYTCAANSGPDPFYLVRTKGDPLALANAIRQKLHQIEPARSVFAITPLTEKMGDNMAENSLRTLLLTIFAATAIALAAIGIYGTLSYTVHMRHREIGLRIALGALRKQITRRFVQQALTVTLAGCIAGVIFSLAGTRVLAGMLYGVSRSDAVTFTGVLALVLLVAVAAAFLPALRAARLDPMQVLRDE